MDSLYVTPNGALKAPFRQPPAPPPFDLTRPLAEAQLEYKLALTAHSLETTVLERDEALRLLAAERERCANIAESMDSRTGESAEDSGYFSACEEIAEKIRGGE